MKKKIQSIGLIFLMVVQILFSILPYKNVEAAVNNNDHIVISFAYGGNGDTSAAVSNSFVELYNPTKKAVSLSGYSLQYAASGSDWAVLELNGTIPSKCSFLIDCGEAGKASKANVILTEFDQTFSGITVNNKGMKFALMSNTNKLTSANPFNIDGNGTKAEGYVDMFGVAGNDAGNTIDGYETEYDAEQSKKKGFFRTGYIDTDNNKNDFELVDFSGSDPILPRCLNDGPSEDQTTDDSTEVNATDKLLIGYIYGSNGKSDAPVSNSFVEIYNPNDYEVVLTDRYSLQYAAAGSSNWTSLDLEGTIAAKGSFLVDCGSGNTTNPNVYITNFDQKFDDVKISNKGVKFVIRGNQETIKNISNPYDTDGNGTKIDGYIDMFGVAGNDVGSTVDGCEKSTFGGADNGQSKQKGFRRINNYQDTDKNHDDFELVDFRTDNPSLPRSSANGSYESSGQVYDGEITHIIEPAKTSVILHTAKNEVILPKTITAFRGNGKKEYVSVSWNSDNYNGEQTGQYTFTGKLITDIAVSSKIDIITITVNVMNESAASYEAQGIALTNNINPASQMGFAWYGSSLNASSVVKISKSQDMTDAMTYDGSTEYVNLENTVCHKVLVKNLEGDTTYYYQLGDGKKFSEVKSFKSGTEDEKKAFTFIYTSDAQVESDADAIAWKNTLESAISKAPNASFIAHAGDQVAIAGNESYWSYFLSPTSVLESIPLAPTVGNRDNNAAYTNHFNLPELPENVNGLQGGVYSFTNGNTLFMVLNTEEKDLSSQIEWLKKTALASNAKWKVVMLHRAIYSSGNDHYKDNIAMRHQLGQVFDELNIDLVLQGHDHSYMRSNIIKNEQTVDTETEGIYYVDPQGTLYLDMAGGGNSQNGKADKTELVGCDYVAVDYDSLLNGSMYSTITVDGDSLTINSYRVSDGVLMDTCGIKKTVATSTLVVNETAEWTNVISAIDAADSGDIITVEMSNAYVVSKEALNELKGKNVTLKINMDNGITWRVNGKDINENIAESIDLGIAITNDAIPDNILNSIKGSNDTLEFSIAHNGSFGFDAMMEIKIGTSYSGKKANLFYYNVPNETLDFVECVNVDEEGVAEFNFSHASEYAIVLSDASMENISGNTNSEDVTTPSGNTEEIDETMPSENAGNMENTTTFENTNKSDVNAGYTNQIGRYAAIIVTDIIVAVVLMSRKKEKTKKEA